MAFYGRWDVITVKQNTYLDSAKPEESCYGMLSSENRIFSPSFSTRRNPFYIPTFYIPRNDPQNPRRILPEIVWELDENNKNGENAKCRKLIQ